MAPAADSRVYQDRKSEEPSTSLQQVSPEASWPSDEAVALTIFFNVSVLERPHWVVYRRSQPLLGVHSSPFRVLSHSREVEQGQKPGPTYSSGSHHMALKGSYSVQATHRFTSSDTLPESLPTGLELLHLGHGHSLSSDRLACLGNSIPVIKDLSLLSQL